MPFDIIKIIDQSNSLTKLEKPHKLSDTAVSFIGQVKQHKTDPDKLFLRSGPLSSQEGMLEFKIKDIVFAEDYKTLTMDNGTAYRLHKLWVTKGSVAVKLEPFVVNDFSNLFDQM